MVKPVKTVIVIGGPTAVGKTAAAIAVANYFHTEIISADSRQCYKEMAIGVARPSAAELAAVPHHFIASHSIHHKVTAATFEQYALDKAAHIFQQKDVAVMVGGTGLYINAFTNGLGAVPEVPEEVRAAIVEEYKAKGLEWLQQEVQQADPLYYASGEVLNPHRLMRALEVYRATGQSILHFRKGTRAERPFRVIKILLELERDILYNHINKRVEAMMAAGLLEEVNSLLPYQQLNALQTVGYKELFHYYNGYTSLEEAVEKIKQNTRHYAKRQLTWFRKDTAYQRVDAADYTGLMAYLQNEIV